MTKLPARASSDGSSSPTAPTALRDRLRGEFVAVGVAVGSGVGMAARATTGDWYWTPIALTGCIALGSLAAVVLRRRRDHTVDHSD